MSSSADQPKVVKRLQDSPPIRSLGVKIVLVLFLAGAVLAIRRVAETPLSERLQALRAPPESRFDEALGPYAGGWHLLRDHVPEHGSLIYVTLRYQLTTFHPYFRLVTLAYPRKPRPILEAPTPEQLSPLLLHAPLAVVAAGVYVLDLDSGFKFPFERWFDRVAVDGAATLWKLRRPA